MIKLVHAVCVVAIVFASSKASADEVTCKTQKGKNLWIAGSKAYNLQKYDDAIAQWEAAYLECEDPGLLFNLAQANRKANSYQRARDLYAAWLRDPRTQNDPDRELVKINIAELDELIEKQKKSVDAPPDGTRPKNGTGDITTDGADTTPGPVGQVPPEPGDETPRRWYGDTWGWILAGSGAAVLLTGTGFLIWSNAIEDNARASRFDDEADRLFDDAESKRTIGAVMTVGGGALLVGGIVHFALYGRSERASRTSSITVGPTSIGFVWSF
jgi:tetratricopeptide (TPR) repeat protein